jgi:hypothetical protein
MLNLLASLPAAASYPPLPSRARDELAGSIRQHKMEKARHFVMLDDPGHLFARMGELLGEN